MKKSVFKSWTVWINLAILIIALIDNDYLKLIGMSDKSITIFIATMAKITALGNIFLRIFVSKTELTISPQEKITE